MQVLSDVSANHLSELERGLRCYRGRAGADRIEMAALAYAIMLAAVPSLAGVAVAHRRCTAVTAVCVPWSVVCHLRGHRGR
jgi:hypothetical protein